MGQDAIKVDIGEALQALQASPELASMINELIAPTLAKQMEVDAQEIERLRLRVTDLLDANNRYQQEGRDARAKLRILETKALGQKAFFRAKQSKLPALEDFTDDQGIVSLLEDIGPLLQQAEANGRYSEADWWLTTIRATMASEEASQILCHGLDTPERVCFYEQDFYVLSNFSSFTLRWKDYIFDTSEAAYHWEKFSGPAGADVRYRILNAASAHEAFKIAERNKSLRRPDWDDVKVDIMRDLLRAKAAQHEYVHRKLLATGDRELVENSWRDDFWGWGPNRDGQNMLGKLWMEVRTEIREANP